MLDTVAANALRVSGFDVRRLGVQTLACGEATVLSTRGPCATVVALR